MSNPPSIAILGPGKVGTAIGVLAVRAGLNVAAVGGRDPAATARAVAAMNDKPRALTLSEAAAAGELVLLCVSDDAIEAVCSQLADAKAFAGGAIVAHCSGALDSGVLAPARDKCGCAVASFHPLQTFPTARAAIERFAGVYCFCEGDERATGVLVELAPAIGARAVVLPSAGKAMYHAAAVMAGNYLTTLMDAAAEMCQLAGVDRDTALAALGVLAVTTAANTQAMGPADALTGPIARGDAGTVRRHLAALASCPGDLQALYRAAGQRTVALAMRKGTIDNDTAETLRNILNSTPQD